MKAHSVARSIVSVIVTILLFAMSATSAWGIVSDYQARGLVSKGVTVAGRDLSGMDEQQVRAAIEDAVSSPMMRPLTVTVGAKSWVLDPRGIVTIDVDSMVDQAYQPGRDATLIVRMTSKLTGKPLSADVKPVYAVDNAAVAAWVKQTAKAAHRKPVDATRTISDYKIHIRKAVPGLKVDETTATAQIAAALTDETGLSSADRVTSLPVSAVKPKVLQSSFKTAIVVSLSQCRIRLYKGARLVKTYMCAPGQPAWPTPTGDFFINNKLSNAPWLNPHSTWSASMPDVIPGGPYNPMGQRKIGINYPGVFMHGIPPSEFGSIGTHASHGCMRMMPASVLDLYGRVAIGDPVYIRP